MKKCLIISDDKLYDIGILKALKKNLNDKLEIKYLISLFEDNQEFSKELNCPVDNLNEILDDLDYYSNHLNKTFDHNNYQNFSSIEFYHQIALSFNHVIGEFDLSEVRLDFIRNLTICLKILEEKEIENVIFTNIPHNQFTVVLLKILEIKNIRYLILRETIVGNYIIEDSLQKNLSNNKEKKINLSLENFINYLKTGKNNINFKKFRDHSIINNKFYNLFFLGNFFFYSVRLINFQYEQFKNIIKLINYIIFKKKNIFIYDKFKKKNYDFKNSNLTIFQRTNYLFLQELKKFKLYRKYKKICTENINLSDKYIYFPLHYQPEATTVPYGNFYFDQINALKILSNLSEEFNFKIFVKEHPDTFNISKTAWTMGTHNRYSNYYKNISNIKNVKILGFKENNLDLIKNSFCIATITGTSAVEALFYNKHSIVFGNAWFKDMSNAFIKYVNYDTLKLFFKNTENYKKINNKDFSDFIEVLNGNSVHLSKSGSYKESSEEHINLIKLFQEKIM